MVIDPEPRKSSLRQWSLPNFKFSIDFSCRNFWCGSQATLAYFLRWVWSVPCGRNFYFSRTQWQGLSEKARDLVDFIADLVNLLAPVQITCDIDFGQQGLNMIKVINLTWTKNQLEKNTKFIWNWLIIFWVILFPWSKHPLFYLIGSSTWLRLFVIENFQNEIMWIGLILDVFYIIWMIECLLRWVDYTLIWICKKKSDIFVFTSLFKNVLSWIDISLKDPPPSPLR